LEEYEDAINTYKKGLEIEPGNQALKEGLKSAEERLNGPDDLGGGGENPF
jgi:hypothetical protein